MKFKSIFFSLCLLFIGATSFAATADLAPTNGDEPLTIKSANKLIHQAMLELPSDTEVKLVAVTKIVEDDAECTVTVNISVGGNGGSVSATAATCKEALAMVIDII